MLWLGFDETWVQLIMQCVSTVKYHVQCNGSLFDYITPSRGLRQGDPLSPYLFLLCAEGLTSLITHEAEQGYLMGVKVYVGEHRRYHICYSPMTP
jgi:hypothetical protein